LPETQVVRSCEKETFETERIDVTQAKLVMGLRTGIAPLEKESAAVQLMTELLGGSAHSLLFLNVREKMSLCYYASSRLDKFNGLMVVSSGIEFKNYEKAKDEILIQLDAVKQGDFTDDELEISKRFIINSYNSFFDSPYMLRDYYFGQKFTKNKDTLSEAIDKVNKVSKQDVMTAFSSVMADTVYFLKGKEE